MAELKPFNETAFYKTTDPALTAILAPQTLALWRCKGRGPKYVKTASTGLSLVLTFRGLALRRAENCASQRDI